MVLGVEHEPELHKRIITSLGGDVSSQQEYFSCYQRELTKLLKGTSEKDREDADQTAKLWNRVGPPPEQQAKWVSLFCKSFRQSNKITERQRNMAISTSVAFADRSRSHVEWIVWFYHSTKTTMRMLLCNSQYFSTACQDARD